MPARATYELRIEGILGGDPNSNAELIAAFDKEIGQPPGPARGGLDSKAGWSDGFVLKDPQGKRDYRACSWDPYHNAYGNGQTLLGLRAEVCIFLEGGLDARDNQKRLLDDVRWFYEFKTKPWYLDLQARLERFNRQAAGALAEAVRFREWKWYCGNGGS